MAQGRDAELIVGAIILMKAIHTVIPSGIAAKYARVGNVPRGLDVDAVYPGDTLQTNPKRMILIVVH